MNKDLLSMFDLTAAEAWAIIDQAYRLKRGKRNTTHLAGKTLGLIFEKPSTRTTVSFAVAMYQLGGFPMILNAQNLQRKRGETIHDTAKTLSRYLDGIMIRAIRHTDVEEFAGFASIPVINGLTDREHPCQVLGDILTIAEKRKIRTPKALKNITVAFVGDGNNMANSWIAAAGILGFRFILSGPARYAPDQKILARAREAARRSGGIIELERDPLKAVREADVLYTDVWTSMGDEAEKSRRTKDFRPYQINRKLLDASPKNSMVMHCLPAIRGEEITAEVMEGPRSVIFDEAENRLHIQKSVLITLLS